MKSYKLLMAFGLMLCVLALIVLEVRVADFGGQNNGDVQEPSNARQSPRNLAESRSDARSGTRPGLRLSDATLNEYEALSLAELEEMANSQGDRLTDEQMKQLIERWVELNPDSAMDFVENFRSDNHNNSKMFKVAMRCWAAINPQEAIAYIQVREEEFFNRKGVRIGDDWRVSDALPIISAEWAKQDVEGALNWVLGLDLGERRPSLEDETLSTLMAVVAKEDPYKAASMADGVNLQYMVKTISGIAEIFASQDFDAAMEWVNSLPDFEKAEATNAAIRGLAKTNSKAAEAYIAAMQPSSAKERAIIDIIGVLATEDPYHAVTFLDNTSYEGTLSKGTVNLIQAWVKTDPDAALDYAMNASNQVVKDNALKVYAMSPHSESIPRRVKAAESISNDAVRSYVIETQLWNWIHTDKEAARAYLDSTTYIPDQKKTYLRKELKD